MKKINLTVIALFLTYSQLLFAQFDFGCFKPSIDISSYCEYRNPGTDYIPRIHKNHNAVIEPSISAENSFWHYQNEPVSIGEDIYNRNEYHHCAIPYSEEANTEFILGRNGSQLVSNSNLLIECERFFAGDIYSDYLNIYNSTLIIRTKSFHNFAKLRLYGSSIILIIDSDFWESSLTDVKLYDNSVIRVFSNNKITLDGNILVGRPSAEDTDDVDDKSAYDYSSFKVLANEVKWSCYLSRKSKASAFVLADKIQGVAGRKISVSSPNNGDFGAAYNANVVIKSRKYLNFVGFDAIIKFGEDLLNADFGSLIHTGGRIIAESISYNSDTADDSPFDYYLDQINGYLFQGVFPYTIPWNIDLFRDCTSEYRYYNCTTNSPDCRPDYQFLAHDFHCSTISKSHVNVDNLNFQYLNDIDSFSYALIRDDNSTLTGRYNYDYFDNYSLASIKANHKNSGITFYDQNDDVLNVDYNTKKLSLENEFNIYPSPAKDVLNIEIVGNLIGLSIKLYSSNGELIKTLVPDEEILVIDISSYNSGMYFIQYGNSIQKVIINNH